MTLNELAFVGDLERISPELASWAEERFKAGATLDKVKDELRAVMKAVERA